MDLPELQQHEIPLDHPDSRHMFIPSKSKPFVAASNRDVPARDYFSLNGHDPMKAFLHRLLDFLQVFVDPAKPEKLWIEDGPAAPLRLF